MFYHFPVVCSKGCWQFILREESCICCIVHALDACRIFCPGDENNGNKMPPWIAFRAAVGKNILFVFQYYAQACFFLGFAYCCPVRFLAVFDEAARKCPHAFEWLFFSFYQRYAVFVQYNYVYYLQWIFIHLISIIFMVLNSGFNL